MFSRDVEIRLELFEEGFVSNRQDQAWNFRIRSSKPPIRKEGLTTQSVIAKHRRTHQQFFGLTWRLVSAGQSIHRPHAAGKHEDEATHSVTSSGTIMLSGNSLGPKVLEEGACSVVLFGPPFFRRTTKTRRAEVFKN